MPCPLLGGALLTPALAVVTRPLLGLDHGQGVIAPVAQLQPAEVTGAGQGPGVEGVVAWKKQKNEVNLTEKKRLGKVSKI